MAKFGRYGKNKSSIFIGEFDFYTAKHDKIKFDIVEIMNIFLFSERRCSRAWIGKKRFLVIPTIGKLNV
ncbi:hypothetical protein U473_10840 [Tepidibacillus decaturensis]|uniref:Uncharacterized protein n=1 Tax=Tepidibacillus decaturensis TaxID=1413211 RepID=A0A135L6L5_9BACI|nr:hypothetical protein U473_10840 [Tepidibacillus decaturensis]